MLAAPTSTANYEIARLDALAPVQCPCGTARRAFADVVDGPASVHWVEISATARTHYHKHMTEIYVILEGNGHIELDGLAHPVSPLSAIMIRPGCRHRAVGNLRLLNIAIPTFDPADEWFDE